MSFRDRFAQRTVEENVKEEEVIENKGEAEYVETFVKSPFFGLENVRNHPSCLDLRLTNGNSKALPYTYFVELGYNPSEGIEIITTTKKVIITGRSLKLLYHFLLAYQVSFVQANIGNDLTEPKSLFVKDIRIEEL